MAEVGVHEANTNLSELPRRREERTLGRDQGLLRVPEDFDAPLDDETLSAFEN